MMKRKVFNYTPTVEVLKLLTPGSLKQNLAKAVRLWVILRSIYGDDIDEVKLELGEEFTFLQWRNLFFEDAPKYHLRDKAPILHAQECRCATKLTDWLFKLYLNVEKKQWCFSFQNYYSIEYDELESLLLRGIINNSSINSEYNDEFLPLQSTQSSQKFSKFLSNGRLFAVTSRNLKSYDFKSLISLGWLKKVSNQEEGHPDKYLKVNKFPDFFLARLQDSESQPEQFINEELSAFNNSLSQPINSVQRFFIHTEYIVHPQLYKRVNSLQKQLKSIWSQDKVPLVKLNYKSAKLYQDTVHCIVYPVCICYYQRALYLFGYGQVPMQDEKDSWSKINWYDYRLDRIIKLHELPKDIDDINIPQNFLDKCQGEYPPSTDDIKDEMSSAWGFEIYQRIELLVLRFDQYFYGNYIKGTERDEMFVKIPHSQVGKLIKSHRGLASAEHKKLLATLESRSENDIYCQVYYRVDDNNIVMRLRAWSPNVEVILPWHFRQRMTQNMEATYKLYR